MQEFRRSLPPAYKERDALLAAISRNQVGYKVRLEGMKGRDTRLLFCTTGILLRRLLVDRNLKGVSHVIVDEIHERGMNEDFLLIVLKDLLPRRPELRLILMSATLNAELFSSYFGGAPMIHIPRLIFDKPEDGVRKIVLATNMAETSITINDVVFVVDCGKAKETSYDALNNTPCLLPTWISKAAARQKPLGFGLRVGPCGRAKGIAMVGGFCDDDPLVTLEYENLPRLALKESVPNSQPHSEVGFEGCVAEQSPSENAGSSDLTPITLIVPRAVCLEGLCGLQRCGLSLCGAVGRGYMSLLLAFLAESAKAQFAACGYSDHLALVRAYDGWRDAERQQSGYENCWRNFLSAQTLKAIDSLRKQFRFLLKDTGLVDDGSAACNAWSNDEHLIRAVICAGLYAGICSVVNKEKSITLKTMEDGQVLLYSNLVNAREPKIPYPWLLFNEKVKVNSVFLRDSTAVSDSVLLLFGGNISRGGLDGHLKMLGGYLEFFMKPAMAETYLKLKIELEELIQNKLLNPKMDIHTPEVRLLISEDQCDGRFVFGQHVQKASKMTGTATPPGKLPRSSTAPGGDNSKSQLQTLLTRGGHETPTYKTKPLKNQQFRATVEFNRMQFMGQPCNNKKLAEKDAATEALQWLRGGTQSHPVDFDHMSMLMTKSKKKHHRRT
ncbi:hypothetical protein HHK36_020170 [Tetracentron sinense]|uniref:RNA helicase n=1 Tax=Tetracentron sinense TaxID=13715 RepID=A0A834YWW5_TETSI|nr:hypothetical protein HHK36_020170 [Tetracentron sinense]